MKSRYFDIETMRFCILLSLMLSAVNVSATDMLTGSGKMADSSGRDSLCVAVEDTSASGDNIDRRYKFRPLQLAVPAVLIGVGFVGLESDWLQWRDRETRDELQEHPHSRLGADDFTQFAPLVFTYGLKLCGLRSLHGYADMTVIAGTAYLLTGISVYSIKSITKVERPDGSSRNSFPSGHTATAFAGAELLRREYWNLSPWIGVAGYTVAAATGFLRMYNNRHWLTDVVAGAGIGILSVQAAYWLYPVVGKAFHRCKRTRVAMAPFFDRRQAGLSALVRF